ncbi:UDP-N-acetylmuramate dehydrogenase [Paraglaciecola chathamensis]|uniref:UDP-N-acetylenolpyruvoylglucosamine reductase n=1 Tax=Paraglaciecola chathamensis TaxID=368405 RepID=A0ABS0WAF8_9ALTE|nr:UDP-N-acetylmuramate dehydrogenase [Paraglaciecola chathamensis]MBJ2135074.1 UDP-N-acetylmuramate dehydrogenase [Paraglaciecola chathamensis]
MNSLQNITQLLLAEMPTAITLRCPLSIFSYWKIGGEASVLVEPKSIQQLQQAIKIINQFSDVPSMIVGDSSNLLFSDKGYHGVIIKIGNHLSKIEFSGDQVYCEAGVWVPELAYRSYRNALSGIEHICGIPGRLGGLIYMNGGSNRRGILENVESVQLVNTQGELETIEAKDLVHSYRTSPFQGDERIIAAATLKLNRADRATVRNDMRNILSSRRKKFPRKLPNCGSVFLSNPKMYDIIGPPGFAIEKVGLKGTRLGGAQISELHANFIVNLGSATSQEVLHLIALARKTVYDKTGFKMDCEVRYIAENGVITQAHVIADKL